MKKGVFLAIALAAVGVFTYFVLQQDVRMKMVFFWSDYFFYALYAALVIALLFIIFSSLKKIYPFLKYPYFFIFLPVAFFPALKCYFKVPYVFCRVCPEQCPWGHMRKALVPGFLAINLDKRFWCYRLCPFGTLQDHQANACRLRLSVPRWIRGIRYLSLLFAVAIVLITIFDERSPVIRFFSLNEYLLASGTLLFVVGVFLFSFLIPRLWCNYFCPIGTTSDLILKAEGLVRKKNQ